MPIRPMVALMVSFLVPMVAECAAPFVECRQGQAAFEMLETARKAVASAGPEVDLGLLRPLDWKMRENVRTGPLLTSEQAAASRFPCHCSWMGWVDAARYTRQYLDVPLALSIMDDGPKPFWVYPLDEEPEPINFVGLGVNVPAPREAVPDILQPTEVPSVSLSSRRLKLHLDTSGVGPWDTAITEVWLTHDGWIWHLYQNAPHGDSLLVALPGEGRFGLRVVVHDANRLASPTPRTGESPQLWVEVDEKLSSLGAFGFRSQGDGPWIEGNQFSGLLHYFGEVDQPGDTKRAKQGGLRHPCGYIKRVETETQVDIRVEETQPREPVLNFIIGWTR